MNKNKVYKVVFRGIILPGFDKQQVIENIHNISRIPIKTIARKFFSGKTVVIRHADTQDYANQLQKKFAQAGIEIYIEEFTEETDASKDELIEDSNIQSVEDSHTQLVEDSHSPPKTIENPTNNIAQTSSKKPYAIVGIILGVAFIFIVAIFFLNETPPDIVQKIPEKIVTSVSQAEKIVTADQVTKAKITPLQPFVTADQINILLKITHKDEFSRLLKFLPLFNIHPDYFKLIEQEINQPNGNIIISKTQPLYIYQSTHHNGIVINIEKNISNAVQSKLKEQIEIIHKNSKTNESCNLYSPLHMFSTDKLMVFSSTKNKQKLNILKGQNINSSFFQLDYLFQTDKNNTADTFKLFYTQANNHNKAHIQSNFLAISAQKEIIQFTPGEQFYKANKELFKLLEIKINNKTSLSNLKIQSLSELSLILISNNHPVVFSDKKTTFIQEQMTQIQSDSSTYKMKPYEAGLDIEIQPQWQSGPFAITTDNFQFEKQLIIELLAKGQNIKNLMEYSRSAKITTHAVHTSNNINILDKTSTSSNLSDNNNCSSLLQTESYFKDISGEQEAYFNDDFITFHAISAKERLIIKPGYKLQDITQIEGKINLQIPDKILQKTIENPNQKQLIHDENFSILLEPGSDKKTLNYLVSNNDEHFISLRAYNDSNEIIETSSYQQQVLIKNTINRYQQIFSESISAIKVFYTNKKNTLSYPFKLKPEVLITSTPLSSKDSPPIVYDNTELDLKPLNSQILADNPQWLGSLVAEEKVLPFYINLFVHKGTSTESKSNTPKIEAVLNIKSSLTHLISQNITAVKLYIIEGEQLILDNFVSFSEKEILQNGEEFINNVQSENLLNNTYLNSYSTFQLDGKNLDTKKNIKGNITLSLPTSFKSHSSKYTSPGQVIKLDGLLVKIIKLTRQQVLFEIRGKIEDLVQLKLYNSQQKLISEPLEFKHINKDKALLTLLYNDNIETIKLVLTDISTKKEYPFSFGNNIKKK